MAKTFNFDDFAPKDGILQNPNCAACEEMIADALDGILSAADQAFFDLHLTGCVSCMEAYSQAKRGAAWLDLLKSSRPEPSGALMERILAQTVGQPAQTFDHPAEFIPEIAPLPLNVLPFVPRPAPVSRFTRFTRLAMEPRLAMTAAMAFFSIALTMNLTGVRLDQLHASDLKPSNLKRSYFETNASVVRYYDNLRVVRVLESRVDDIRQSTADDREERGSRPAPESKPKLKPQALPEPKQQPVPQGTSRREAPLQEPSLVHASYRSNPARLGRFPTPAALVPFRMMKTGGLA